MNKVEYILNKIQAGKKPVNGLSYVLTLISVLDSIRQVSDKGQTRVVTLLESNNTGVKDYLYEK
jgi:hypothetical protein